MDVSAFCRQSNVLIVAGKGGVGKTTMVAALARMAANVGLSVLVVELEGRRGITSAFGDPGDLGYAGTVLTAAGADDLDDAGSDEKAMAGGTVHARMITPDDALLEYLADHGLRRMSKRLQSSGVLDVVASAIPGIKDVLVLGKIKQIERSGVADLILVDAPATGHTMTFLSSASGLLDAARGGPVRTQAADVVELLTDPARCQVALVTLPEEMPVNEVVEAAYQLEDKVGIALGPVITNACYAPLEGLDHPAAEAAARAGVALDDAALAALEEARVFRATRQDLQREQLDRLAAELPLPQLRAPFLFSATIGPEELDILAASLAAGVGALPEPKGRPQSVRA
ncbi:MAG TPA: ArsA-related P-loop ATPase [Acidimicrobiales bacterium]